MAKYYVEGGNQLRGDYIPQGAKNEALQVIPAALLTSEEITYYNVPEILDVINMLKIIENLGANVQKLAPNTFKIKCDKIYPQNLIEKENIALFRQLRGSVLLIGPLLARFGKVAFPSPGGDKIGRRSIDTHLNAFKALGVKVNYDPHKEIFELEASGIKNDYVLLEEPSVTGTANLLLFSALFPKSIEFYNCACEPYIIQTTNLLSKMGATITGAGSNRIIINGKSSLKGATHTLLSDMIEIGSIIGLAAATSSEITIKNAYPKKLGNIIPTFRKLGLNIIEEDDNITITAHNSYKIQERIGGGILTIYDGPWPGFPPDLISIAIVTAVQGIGSVLIHQKMFESRLFFVDRLIEMGAKIILCDPHRVVVIGLEKKYPLRGIVMSSPDIRAGMALLIAALSAQGTSVIHNIEQIQRGYENIHNKLNQVGAKIKLEE